MTLPTPTEPSLPDEAAPLAAIAQLERDDAGEDAALEGVAGVAATVCGTEVALVTQGYPFGRPLPVGAPPPRGHSTIRLPQMRETERRRAGDDG
jgi:hypothetical protein